MMGIYFISESVFLFILPLLQDGISVCLLHNTVFIFLNEG